MLRQPPFLLTVKPPTEYEHPFLRLNLKQDFENNLSVEIQPLCRYHFRPLKHPESTFFIIDLLPHDGVFDQYALKYVGSASTIKHTWFKPSIDELKKGPTIGSFEEVKTKLQELMASSFQNEFRCEVSYLAAYFK